MYAEGGHGQEKTS